MKRRLSLALSALMTLSATFSGNAAAPMKKAGLVPVGTTPVTTQKLDLSTRVDATLLEPAVAPTARQSRRISGLDGLKTADLKAAKAMTLQAMGTFDATAAIPLTADVSSAPELITTAPVRVFDSRLPKAPAMQADEEETPAVDVAMASSCYAAGPMGFSITATEEVAFMYYGIYSGMWTITQDNLMAVVQGGQMLQSVGTYSFYPRGTGWVSVFVIGFDANGELAGADVDHGYMLPAHNATEWKSLGKGAFTDDTFLPLFGESTPIPAFEVEVLENVSTPGVYRLVDPYQSHPYASNFNFHADHTHYLEINAANPDSVVIEEQSLGFEFGGMKFGFYSLSAGAMDQERTITFPVKGLVTKIDGTGYYANLSGNFSLVVPEEQTETPVDPPVKEPDYSVSVTIDSLCYSDNVIPFTVTAGEDVATLLSAIVSDYYDGTASNYAVIARNGEEIDPEEYVFDDETYEGWLSFFVVALDADGNLVGGDVAHAFMRRHVAEEWTSLGMGQFTDDTFLPVYSVDSPVPAYEVEVLESVSKPGLYRLVDPYATYPFIDGESVIAHGHGHYLEIDATDSTKVAIDMQPMGLMVFGEDLGVTSIEDGTLTGSTITFPVKGVALLIEGDGLYYANQLGRFGVKLPEKQTEEPPVGPQPEWKSLGMGRFTDGFVSGMYMKSETWNVEVEQNTANPGFYRIVNPYTNGNCPWNADNKYSIETDVMRYITFNATNPDSVVIDFTDHGERIDLGVVINANDGECQIYNYKASGTMANDIIFFESKVLAVTTFNSSSAYYADAVKLALPGAPDFDVKLTIEEFCQDNNEGYFAISGAPDAAQVRCVTYFGLFDNPAIFYNEALANAQPVEVGTYKVNLAKSGWYTIFVGSFDADGNLMSATADYLYGIVHNEEEWTELGTAKFTDDTFAPLYDINEPFATYEVTVLENNKTPGIYRLVNPYATHPLALSQDITVHPGHNHYLDINASEPAKVTLTEQPMGFSIDGEKLSVRSLDDGTMNDRTITFPANGLVVRIEGNLYFANQLSSFTVELPEPDAITEVTDEADSAVKTIFDLQGRRLNSVPAHGVYIINGRKSIR